MKHKRSDMILSLLFVLLAVMLLYPLVITFTNSFMSTKEVYKHYVLQKSKMVGIPEQVTFASYGDLLFNRPKYLLYFLNSVKITVPVVMGQLIVSFFAAYAFVRTQFKGKQIIFSLYIIVMLLPTQVVLVPNYMVIQKLHLMDNQLAIILPGIFSPFGTFLLTQFMKQIPSEYIEAAEIDGANDWHILSQLFLPIMKSGLFSLAILTFIEYWNIVEPALVFIQDIYKEPLSIFLSQISDEHMEIIFAASCFYMIPVLLVFLYGQSYLIEGIELSGVKG